MKAKKKYAVGGKVTPGPADKFKKPEWVEKGRSPQDPASKDGITPAEYLEDLTWKRAVEALDSRGVSMIDQGPKSKNILRQGNANVLDRNYELAIKKAKEYGVYDRAREQAVKDFRAWQVSQKKK